MCTSSQLTAGRKVGGGFAHTVTDTAGTHRDPTASAEQMANETEERPIMTG